MRKSILTTLFILCSVIAYGQATIQGTVVNSNVAGVADAKIDVLQSSDDKLIVSIFTDQEGKYRIENINKGNYIVKASYMGSYPIHKKVILWDKSTMTVDFTIESEIQLEEVKVVSTGIDIKGDTTTYIVRSFTSGRERNLKGVLERLPNIKIDTDSKAITANGKQVSRILLENNDLFQGNTTVPLENLSAEGVERIEVIDNYSEFNIYEGFSTTNETVLNVGVNSKMRNKLKGDIEMLGGVLNKYNIKNSSLYIGKKSMLSAIVSSNNIGNKLLDFQDIVSFSGGFTNLLSGDNPSEKIMTIVQTYSNFINARKDIKQRENGLVSLNYTANPNKKLKVSINGIYNYDHHKIRNEQDYSYQTGLQYSDSSNIKGMQHNALLNLKIHYMPSEDFNVVYTSNSMLSSKREKTVNSIYDNKITYRDKPDLINSNNELLFIKRIDKNAINLLLTYGRRDLDGHSLFSSMEPYYPTNFYIPSQYRYNTRHTANEYAANLFYLHRLNEAYYLRFGVKGRYNQTSFKTHFDEEAKNDLYHNDATLNNTSYTTDALLGKDKGSLQFNIRLRYALLHANTNIARALENRTTHLFSPALQIIYKISLFQQLTLNYEYSAKENPITSLLDATYLTSFNRMVNSAYTHFYYKTHQTTLLHFMTFPFNGFTIMNSITYENSKDNSTNNNLQEGYISITERRNGDRQNTVSLMSSMEYKFLTLPLNLKTNFIYNYSYSPQFNFDELYKTKLNMIGFLFQATTFYKKGFNGKAQWSVNKSAYRGLPVNNKTVDYKLSGTISWQNAKFYAAVNTIYNRYNLNDIRVNNLFYGFEARYNIKKNIELKLTGTDVTHLSERKQTTGTIDSYYSVNSRVWYMPGNILLGVLLKY